MTEDLETIRLKLAPEVLQALAEYLAGVDSPCQSKMLLHHGPGGIVTRVEGERITQFLDVRQGKVVRFQQT